MEPNTWTYYIADEDKPSAESEEGFHWLAAYVLCKDREYLLTLNSFINQCVCTIQKFWSLQYMVYTVIVNHNQI